MVKKTISTFSAFLLAVSVLSFLFIISANFCTADSANFTFEKKVIYSTVPAENINIPASYNLTIKNTGNLKDDFRIYSFLDLELNPIESFTLWAGNETTLNVTILPHESIKKRCGFGPCGIQYYIKSKFSGTIEDSLDIKVVPISQIINLVMPDIITKEDTSFLINISNTENINLEKISIISDWDFCKADKNISLGPKSSESFTFVLDGNEIKKANAGNYTLKLIISVNEEYNYTVEKSIILKEFTSIISTDSVKRNFLGYTKIITRKNKGNSPKLVTIEVVKSNFEKVFTSFSIEAAYEESADGSVKIGWQRELEPGEIFTVELTTDYSWLVLILVLIAGGAVALYIVKRPRIIIKKKAFRIRAKGGEFALKILIAVKNVGLDASDVKCVDYIPRLAKIHERFGAIKPDKIEKNRLEWNFNTLAPGEEKIFSYIIYSDVVPVGTIGISKAAVSYTNANGKRKVEHSNKLFIS